jgi:hypothetical protein
MKTKYTAVFTDKQLQQVVDFRNEIDYSVWKRKKGSKRVSFYFTYADTSDVTKLTGVDMNTYYGNLRKELREYIVRTNCFKDEYHCEGTAEVKRCKCCNQIIRKMR